MIFGYNIIVEILLCMYKAQSS